MKSRLLSLAVLAMLGTPASAQVLEGALRDSLSGAPVTSATMTLLGDSGTVVQVETDGDGRFILRAAQAGWYRLRIEAIGYRPLTSSPFRLSDGQVQSVQVAATPLATVLDPVEGEAAEFRAPRFDGFVERREQGLGSFLTRAEFERDGSPLRPTQVLQRMRGVRLRPNPKYMKGGLMERDTRRWLIDMNRRGPRTFGHAKNEDECAPLVFLDGRYLGDTKFIDLDGMLAMNEIEAVEAHSSAAGMPQVFNRPGAACGVIVFWTRA